MGHIYSVQNATSTTEERLIPLTEAQILEKFKTAQSDRPLQVVIRNDDAAIIQYIGATGLSSSDGFAIPAGASIGFDVHSAKDLADIFVIAASGTPEIHVLVLGPLGS